MEQKWHISQLSDIEKTLNTNIENGLTAREARNRLARESKRENGRKRYLFVAPHTSKILIFLSFLLTPSVLLLAVMSVLCAVFGNMLTGFLITIISLLCAGVGGFIFIINERNLSSMEDFSSPVVRVIRGGNKLYTDGRNVVVGDLITVRAGDLVACDARIITSDSLVVKEILQTTDGIRNRIVSKSAEYTYPLNTRVQSPDALNMLYAGSAVLEGEAIAVAVATGADVYLSKHIEDGLLSGKRASLEGVEKLKPTLRKICFLSAIGLLLLCITSLVTLPQTPFVSNFLLLLSTVAFVSVELISVLIEYIATSRIKKLAATKSRENGYAAIKSVSALDALSVIDELILMGDVGICDGSYHVTGAYVCGHQLDSLTPEIQEGNRLLTYIHTYLKALREIGIDNEFVRERIDESLWKHLKKCGFDTDSASAVLLSLYYSNNCDKNGGYACAETADTQYRTALSFGGEIVDLCGFIREKGDIRPIDEKDKQIIRHYTKNAEFVGAKCLYIVSGDAESIIFEGVVALEHHISENVADTVLKLKNAGVGVTILMGEEGIEANIIFTHPALASLFDGKIALASEFERDGRSIYDSVGDYCAYAGFGREQYAELVLHLKEKGRTVAVYAADNEYNGIMSCADIAISCDGIRYSSEKYKESVYDSLTPDGRDTGARCSQQTRLLCGALVNRKAEDANGLDGIYNAIIASRGIYVNISRAIMLLFSLMTVLLSTVFMSVVSGNVLISAVQSSALAGVGMFMPFILMADMTPTAILTKANLSYTQYPLEMLKNSARGLIVRAIVCSTFAIVLKILDALGLFGDSASYALPVYISLMLAMLVDIYLASRKYRSIGEINSYWIKVLLAYAILVGICVPITQPPIAEEILPNGIGTYEFIAVPVFVLVYVAAVALTQKHTRRGNKD